MKQKGGQDNTGEPKPCTTCWGYGLGALGEANPMGPMDAADGMPTKPSNECSANANPRAERKS